MKKHIKPVIWLLLFVMLFTTSCKERKANGPEGEVQLTPQYNKKSTMFTLSMFANVNYGLVSTPGNLRSHLDSSIRRLTIDPGIVTLVGAWRVVWGPVNYTEDTTSNRAACVSDNVMMVLKGANPSNPKIPLYVIAIAATNADSPYDWADEDFQSASMVAWPTTTSLPNTAQFANKPTTDSTITNKGRYISTGTATGLNVLYNIMTDPRSGLSLMEFLKTDIAKSSTKAEVTTSGHSLAGALGPSLALSLKDNQPYWDPSGKCTISSYATAGASPGNMNWAAYFNNQLGKNFVGAYNKLDIVPHAFQYSMMQQLPGLYDSLIKPVAKGSATNCFVGQIISCAAKNVRGFNYTSIFPGTSFFTNPFPLNVDSLYKSGLDSWNKIPYLERPPIIAEIVANCGATIDPSYYYAFAYAYGAVATAEHSIAYINLYGAQQANAIYSTYLSNGGNFDTFTFLLDVAGNPLFYDCVL